VAYLQIKIVERIIVQHISWIVNAWQDVRSGRVVTLYLTVIPNPKNVTITFSSFPVLAGPYGSMRYAWFYQTLFKSTNNYFAFSQRAKKSISLFVAE